MIPVLLAMLLYGIIHSMLASHRTKQLFQNRFGERAYHGLYRVFYNVLAVLAILPVVHLVVFRPGDIVWNVRITWELPLMLIQAAGLIGLIISLLQIDLGRFGGLQQFRAYINDDALPLPPEKLQIKGIYAIVRHPLYLFSLMVIWPVTTMTEAYLGFCIGATIYFVIGSYYEERRMVQIFGQEYVDYRTRVPWLVPALRRNNTSN